MYDECGTNGDTIFSKKKKMIEILKIFSLIDNILCQVYNIPTLLIYITEEKKNQKFQLKKIVEKRNYF